MKHNRSMKEIIIPKTYFKDKEEQESPWSPKNFQPENCAFSAKKCELRSTKNTQSQKNLININPLNSSIASPKYLVQQKVSHANILTPANKNVSAQ